MGAFDRWRSTGRRSVRASAVAALTAVFWLQAGPASAQDAGEPTWADDVAPILYDNCVECHRPGSFAPMSLTTWENAREWAPLIRMRVEERIMPPWHVDKTLAVDRSYANDVSLTDQEIETIVAWVDAGAPQGDPADAPPPPDIPEGDAWELQDEMGEPDIVFRSTPYDVIANGQDQWWGPDVVVDGLEEPRFIKAYEFKPAFPNGLKVVHHGHATFVQDDRYVGIAHYGVGKRYEIFPENVGMQLPAGEARISWNLHYFPVGEEVPNDVVEVGLWFYPEGEEPEIETEGEVLFRVDRIHGHDEPLPRGNDILIPPHGYQVLQGAHVLERPTLINSFRPHMHMRGKEMSMEAIYPDGTREVLGKVDDYYHIWQLSYIYEEESAPLLPAGTVLLFTSVFDNTERNRLNPDPNQWVVFGRRGVDEMSHMWVGITYLEEEEYERMKREREDRPENVAQVDEE